jgi:mannose-6-phosphate isomerase-like protein (cupin superfamily)
MKPRKVTVNEAMKKLPGPNGERWTTIFEDGETEVELYAPRGTDPQTPHTRQEIYIVVKGDGIFFDGGKRKRFQEGDFLYVPAGVEHRFESFSDDLIVWAFFWK